MGQGPTTAKVRLHFVRPQLSDFNLNPRPPFIAKQKQMLIRIGYDIALRIPAPTAVVCVLRVHPSREGDLVGPEKFRLEPELAGRGIHGRIRTIIAAASMSLEASFVFSTTQSFAILANWTPTHPTRLSTTSEIFPSRHSVSCCRADTVKSTASCLILLGERSAQRLLDGRA